MGGRSLCSPWGRLWKCTDSTVFDSFLHEITALIIVSNEEKQKLGNRNEKRMQYQNEEADMPQSKLLQDRASYLPLESMKIASSSSTMPKPAYAAYTKPALSSTKSNLRLINKKTANNPLPQTFHLSPLYDKQWFFILSKSF